MSEAAAPRILVIKLGAFGDVVLALGVLALIRRHHADAEITLLTRPPHDRLVEGSGLVDRVWLDRSPRLARPLGVWRWRRQLCGAGFARVYDLQNSDRTAFYYQLLWPRRPEWVGRRPGCSHPTRRPEPLRHAVDWVASVVRDAGLGEPPAPACPWLTGPITRFKLPARVVVLVPGSSPHRLEKRWPAERYAALAGRLAARGLTPVVIGTAAERDATAAIVAVCPAAVDLTGTTGFGDLAALGRVAVAAVGNDTGPMHLLGVAGCPVLVLFLDALNPGLRRPLGPLVRIESRPRLDQLSVEAVEAGLDRVMAEGGR